MEPIVINPFAQRITAAWNKSRDGIIEVQADLVAEGLWNPA